ncbi:hypothetical protein IEO21_06638 [Rhodonia placenta]|uniref:Uncharacterized protein n=1 Tax=Rhodonia placenta TaxID=104341 RepID=A0A8H7NZV3_9APHY|nr:hypothetical protein IEO21_06638 [Postia placenta]
MYAGRDRGWPAIDIECRGWGGGCGLRGRGVIECVIAGAVAGEGEGVLSAYGRTARSGCEEGDMTAVVLDARRRREEADGNDRACRCRVCRLRAAQRREGKEALGRVCTPIAGARRAWSRCRYTRTWCNAQAARRSDKSSVRTEASTTGPRLCAAGSLVAHRGRRAV